MYAMSIQNDVLCLVLRENCKSKQMTDFITRTSSCRDTISHMYIRFTFVPLINVLNKIFRITENKRYNLFENIKTKVE